MFGYDKQIKGKKKKWECWRIWFLCYGLRITDSQHLKERWGSQKQEFLPWRPSRVGSCHSATASSWKTPCFCWNGELESSPTTPLWIPSLQHSQTELHYAVTLDKCWYVAAPQIFTDSFCALFGLNFPRTLIILKMVYLQGLPPILPSFLGPVLHFTSASLFTTSLLRWL